MLEAEVQGGRLPRLLQAAIDAFSLPDLRSKILFTLALLAIYRFAAHIPMPGINEGALANLFEKAEPHGNIQGTVCTLEKKNGKPQPHPTLLVTD